VQLLLAHALLERQELVLVGQAGPLPGPESAVARSGGEAVSAKKRRRKAQLARLQQLDRNHIWLYLMSSPRRDGDRAMRLWWRCIVPLGDKLEKQKAGAWAALHRCDQGKAILMDNYRRRTT
jgi:hypothetical protein